MLALNPTARSIARAAIVVCSLSVAGYLVVDAQRPAHPPASSQPEAVRSAPAAAPADLGPSAPAQELEIVDEHAAQDARAAESPAFLFSSKTLSLGSEFGLTPTPEAATTVVPGEATPKLAAPVFLPSSKIRLQGDLLRPVLTPSEAPAEPVEEP